MTTGGNNMALIQTTPPEKAEGKLAELYAEVEQLFRMIPARLPWMKSRRLCYS